MESHVLFCFFIFVLFLLSRFSCQVLPVISPLFCPGYIALTFLSWLSCPGCPVLTLRPVCAVTAVLSLLPCPSCPVLVVCPILAVLVIDLIERSL
jgi:hypothetical protein